MASESDSQASVRRQRPRKSLLEPDISQGVIDLAERKRVLNVLAQRRYRQRKRQKLERLESQVTLQSNSNGTDQGPNALLEDDPSFALDGTPLFPEIELDPPQIYDMVANFEMDELGFNFTIPPAITEALPSIPTASSKTSGGIPSDSSSSSSSQIVPPPSPTLSDLLQTTEAADFTFPDSFELPVSSLSLLRASLTIAVRLRSSDILWNPTSTSVFLQPNTSPETWHQNLPLHLRPTKSQLTIPHHPILDIIPWPKARQRLINMFAMPEDLWPTHRADGTRLSVFRLVYDLEDDGVRVHGEDPTQASSWEVRQDFVDSWWWSLDHEIINSANKFRHDRREAPLMIGPGSM